MRGEDAMPACARLMAGHAEALKEDLLRKVVLPRLARLRAGNGTRWNEAGWYAALDAQQLAAFAALGTPEDGPFAPDPGQGNWYPAETAGDGRVFRFFHHAAWLTLAAPAGAAVLCFDVPHAVLPEALAGLRVTVDGKAVAHTLSQPDAHVEAPVGAALLADAGRFLRIGFETPVAAVPALVYPGSVDRRLLSLAVTMPAWREE